MKKGAKKEKNLKVQLNQKSSPEMAKQQSNCNPVTGMQWPFSHVVPPQPEFSFSTAVPAQNIVFQDFLGRTLSRYDHASPSRSNQVAAPMTIFYSGAVHLFHDISPEKAELIMGMASQSKIEAINETINAQTEREILRQNLQTPQQNLTPSSDNFLEFYAKGALAMARKATLARFLEKRKHRLIYAACPYHRSIDKSSNFSPQAPKNVLELNFMLPEEEETSSSAVDLESRCSTSIL